MITFAIALYSEAKDIIVKSGLKKLPSEHIIQVFEGEDCRVLLTGCGMITAASAVSRYFTLFPASPDDLFVNLGIAGLATDSFNDTYPVGTCCLINKITEQCTGRTFYPDILFRHQYPSLPVFTSPVVITKQLPLTGTCLIDMEASALYQAALPYISPERMFFFKIISDIVGQNNKTNSIRPEELCALHTDSLLQFLLRVQRKIRSESYRPVFSASLTSKKQKIRELLPMTAAMEQDFERLFTYAGLASLPLESVMNQFLDEFPLTPIRGKKQAMPYFNRFRELLLASEPDTGSKEATVVPSRADTTPEEMADYLPFFTQVYLEKELSGQYANTQDGPAPILIDHYKDVFNRSHQNFSRQKKAPSLIFAKKQGTLIYPGAPVCQSFGNEHFYYTSCMMNCIYHCDYCYLQGMYPSGHVVVFVNLTDYFNELELLLKEHPVYLCVSYDTDLLALESRFGFIRQWLAFAATHPDLTLEIRTKSGNDSIFASLARLYSDSGDKLKQNVIFAWTLSPQELVSSTEHGAASLSLRLKAAKAAKEAGFCIRLCFDPMIFHSGWKASYRNLVKEVFDSLSPEELFDASIGVFRISTEYLKNMRKKRPDSAIVQYPYITEQGVSHYGALSEEMVHYLYRLLAEYLPEEKIFIWNGGT